MMAAPSRKPIVIVTKANKFAKEREEKAARAKREQEEAAQIFDSFAASFAEDEEKKRSGKTFVRGGVIQKGDTDYQAVQPGEGSYTLTRTHTQAGKHAEDAEQGSGKPISAEAKPVTAAALFAEEEAAAPAPPPEPRKKLSQIELFAQELANKQAKRAESGSAAGRDAGATGENAVHNGGRGDSDASELDSCNIYVTNLAPTVTEEVLENAFARYGHVLSVKIMWPRTEEERARSRRHTGFVLFARRRDAEDAMEAMQQSELEGSRLSLSWAKAFRGAGAVGGAQIPPPPASAFISRNDAPTSGLAVGHARASVAQQGALLGADPSHESIPSGAPTVKVQPPEDSRIRALIDACAEFISIDGQPFEALLMQHARSQQEDPDSSGLFWWLFEPQSPEAVYFRWKVYSLVNRDGVHFWSEKPFQIWPGGAWWIPPPMRTTAGPDQGRPSNHASALSRSPGRRDKTDNRSRSRSPARSPRRRRSDSPDPDRNRRRPRRGRSRSNSPGFRGRGKLYQDDYESLQQQLAALSLERPPIRAFMVFSMDHAHCAQEIVDELATGLKDPSAPAQELVARLYAASDLLHNSASGIRNASTYRSALQAILPDVFENLGHVLRSITGRLTSAAMRERVMRVLAYWDRESIFPPIFLSGLEATFLRRPDAEIDVPPIDVGDSNADDLTRKCRTAGVSTTGSVADMLGRLAWANHYIRQKLGVHLRAVPAAAAATSAEVSSLAEGAVKLQAVQLALGPSEPGAEPAVAAPTASNTFRSIMLGSGPAAPVAAPSSSWAVVDNNAAGDDEDVDGVPLDSVPPAVAGEKRSLAQTSTDQLRADAASGDDDDIDGVPLPAVSGEPIKRGRWDDDT